MENQIGTSTASGMLQGMSAKASLLVGFLGAFSLLSLAGNIVLGTLLFKGVSGSADAAPVVTAPLVDTNNQANQAANDNTPPPVQTFTITKQDHVKGPASAPVTIIEYSDFQCPYCAKFFPTTQQVVADYGNKVRFVYRHFPLVSIHPYAEKAAEASECASEQGKFWQFHDLVFTNQAKLNLDQLKTWGKELGLNTTQYNNCLDSGKYATRVQTDAQEGDQKGVRGTPATFVNGQLISGALPYESFKQIVDQALNGK